MKNNRIVPGCSGMIPNKPNKKSRSGKKQTPKHQDYKTTSGLATKQNEKTMSKNPL